MSLRAPEIGEVVTEIAPLLRGERIRRVFQQDPYTLLFKTQGPVLSLSAHPRASRVSLLTVLPPRQPVGSFAQGLRRHVESRTILELRQLDDDRAVALVLTVGDRTLQVVAELTGHHGNLFLVEDGLIRSSLFPNRSKRRNNAPGHPYVSLLPAPGEPDQRPSRFRGDPRGANAAVTAHYEQLLEQLRRQETLARVARPLRRALRHQRRLLARLEQDEGRHRARAAEQRWGELLLAHPHLTPDHADRVSVPDLFADQSPDPPLAEIPLDPRRTAVQNASRYLARAAKGRRGLTAIKERMETARQEIERIEHALAILPTLEDAALGALMANAPAQTSSSARGDPPPGRRRRAGGPGPSGQARADRKAARRFLTSRGQPVFVGRGAEGNHHLTFRMARGRDLWLHARDVPGAHVVLWMPDRSATPAADALLEAALLAKHYSGARQEAQCDVQWARVKHLRRGARPGEVYVSKEKTLRVRHDPARTESILSSRAGRSSPVDLPDALLPSGPSQEDSDPSGGSPGPELPRTRGQ